MSSAGLAARTAGAGLALAVVAIGIGCTAGGGARPTEPAVPVLIIVTVTPGLPPTPTIAVARRYTVQEGDTVSGVADRFGISEEALMRANRLTNRDLLLVGTDLVIPAPDPSGETPPAP